MTRSITASFAALVIAGLSLAACDAKENPYEVKKKETVDLHSYEKEMTPEELAEARKAAGHDSMDEIAAENAIMFEKGAREYIKTRVPEYRELVTEMRGYLDEIEKGAPKWKEKEGSFEKFKEGYKEDVKAFLDVYDVLTANGVEGGNTQADLGWAVRAFEALNNDLSPDVFDNAQLAVAIKDIRDRLDKVSAAIDEIEKDETLEVNPLYKAPKRDAKKKKK
ncbi:hypothetical protein DB30_07632 [Enhygromyxa salina]|uniref:Lipoprotein n=1 Tax=Enhygromyxa salina TaxID=215803 RepID=A0A0C2CRI5_9BACT|nr:hypothetical protein [Enhygromyxa salina]KIG13786.1 hypothetical protein DB30_07632 [Enhygromyxa salina]